MFFFAFSTHESGQIPLQLRVEFVSLQRLLENPPQRLRCGTQRFLIE